LAAGPFEPGEGGSFSIIGGASLPESDGFNIEAGMFDVKRECSMLFGEQFHSYAILVEP
jgi:hypothetical protein